MARSTAPENFDPLFSYGAPDQGPQHWVAAVCSSSLIYVLVAVAVVTIGTATKQIIQEKKGDLTFVETVVKEPPTPPPPAPGVEPNAAAGRRSCRAQGNEDPQARYATPAEGTGGAEELAAREAQGSGSKPGQGGGGLWRPQRSGRRGWPGRWHGGRRRRRARR